MLLGVLLPVMLMPTIPEAGKGGEQNGPAIVDGKPESSWRAGIYIYTCTYVLCVCVCVCVCVYIHIHW